MEYEVRVFITYKPEITDVKGREYLGGLQSLGIAEGVLGIQTGKIIDLNLNHDPSSGRSIDEFVTAMCEQLLAHPAIEQFQYQLMVVPVKTPPET
jgi:phosphoribosylformylglycinamidine synthase PurS subunit